MPLVCSLLLTFSKREQEGFLQYIACDYFNTDLTLVELAKVIFNCIDRDVPFNTYHWIKIYKATFNSNNIIETLNKNQKKLLNTKLTLLHDQVRRFLEVFS